MHPFGFELCDITATTTTTGDVYLLGGDGPITGWLKAQITGSGTSMRPAIETSLDGVTWHEAWADDVAAADGLVQSVVEVSLLPYVRAKTTISGSPSAVVAHVWLGSTEPLTASLVAA